MIYLQARLPYNIVVELPVENIGEFIYGEEKIYEATLDFPDGHIEFVSMTRTSWLKLDQINSLKRTDSGEIHWTWH